MANKPENLKPFSKGVSGNPKGRPVGSKSFHTLYREAIIKLATEEKIDPDSYEAEIIKRGIKRASKDYRFYKDTLDRKFGQPVAKSESTVKNELNLSDETIDALLKARYGRKTK